MRAAQPHASNTCPRVVEHFGAAEVWGLKLSPEWVGTAADKDIPLPDNVRRYYIPGTAHGGGRGGFDTQPLEPPTCPGSAYGTGKLPTTRAAYGNCERVTCALS